MGERLRRKLYAPFSRVWRIRWPMILFGAGRCLVGRAAAETLKLEPQDGLLIARDGEQVGGRFG